jgi:hypothetical protein
VSTSIFDWSNVERGGKFSAPFSLVGTQLSQFEGLNSEVRFVATGTACDIGIYGSNDVNVFWSVDGGAESSAIPASGLNWLSLFTGLSDAAHTVVFRRSNAVTYLDTISTTRITGSSPACALPSGYTNTQYRIYDASGLSEDNSVAAFGVEGYDKLRWRGSFRFKATPDSSGTIRVWARTDAAGDARQDLAICVDGVPSSMVFASPASTWGWVSFTSLPHAAEHTFRVVVGSATYCYSMCAPGGTVNTTALTAFPADFWLGDSITGATNGPTHGDASNFPAYYGLKTDRGWQIVAQAGSSAFGYGQTHKGDAGAASPAVTNVFDLHGANDSAGGSTTGQFLTAVTDIVTKQATDLPSAKIWWVGIVPLSSWTNRATYDAVSSGYVAGDGDSDTAFIDLSGLSLTGAGDNQHPNDADAIVIGDALIAATSGPTSIECTLAVTLAAMTVAGVGTVKDTGSGSVGLDPMTLAGTGAVHVAGTLAATLANMTVAGVGIAVVTGSDAIGFDPMTCAATATVRVSGALTSTFAAMTVSASGSVFDPAAVHGATDGQLGPMTLAGAAAVRVSGSMSATFANMTVAGTGGNPSSPGVFIVGPWDRSTVPKRVTLIVLRPIHDGLAMEAVRTEKTPTEDLLFEYDLKNWKTFRNDPPGSVSTPTDWDGTAISDLTLGQPAISGTVVQCRIAGGSLTGGPASDGKYYIRFVVTSTTGGYAGEIDVVLYVRRPRT